MEFIKKEIPEFKVIRYISDKYVVSASRHGISFSGESKIISDQADLEVLAECIGKAWQYFQAMRGENGISVGQDS